jgi:hypothetical protein
MEKIIRRILREITETEYLYWRLPKKLINELGIELYDEDDVVYLNEIHFDTREILVELYTHINGELEWYDGITNVPSTFKGVYSFPLDELPKLVKDFIGRRLDPKYMKYLVTEEHIMKKTIRLTESQNKILWLRRRLDDPEINELLTDIVIEGFDYTDPCNYDTYSSYEINIVNDSALTFINSYTELYSEDPFESNPLLGFVAKVILSKHRNRIQREYRDRYCDEDDED